MSRGSIMVGLSGGVDSATSAALLKQAGYDVSALFMKNWEEDDRFGTCPAEEDAADAAAICELLNIRLYTRNFASEYWDNVFEHFLAEYRAGRTPNPDIACNREIKFKTFLEHATDLGAELIATGHYARRRERDGRQELLRGLDPNKDQSYFLYTLGQAPLERTRFPLGELRKPEVREIARREQLPVSGKKDSTGICFIGERHFKTFLSTYLPHQPGDIRTPEGELLGQHDGLMYYTLGQRQGLGIGGTQGGSGQPWYVLHKDLASRTLIVGQGHDHPWLFADELSASQVSWVQGQAPASRFRCQAKTRYRQADQACEVLIDGASLRVQFADPQRAITPGQSLVLYRDEVCLGGAVIDSAQTPAQAAA
ncbi:MAG: tRNA 2-thiouridine(34) synthase MnmA [Pseudomonadota bacterium]